MDRVHCNTLHRRLVFERLSQSLGGHRVAPSSGGASAPLVWPWCVSGGVLLSCSCASAAEDVLCAASMGEIVRAGIGAGPVAGARFVGVRGELPVGIGSHDGHRGCGGGTRALGEGLPDLFALGAVFGLSAGEEELEVAGWGG